MGREMCFLIRIEMTLTVDGYVRILSYHLYPFIFIVHSDGLGYFENEIATLQASRVPIERPQKHFSDFILIDYLNPPKLVFLGICVMPCNLLFRRNLHPVPGLWIVALLCRIHRMNYLQDTFTHYSSPCYAVLR